MPPRRRNPVAPFPTEADFEDELENPNRRRTTRAASLRETGSDDSFRPSQQKQQQQQLDDPARTIPGAPVPTEGDLDEADFEDELKHPDRRQIGREKTPYPQGGSYRPRVPRSKKPSPPGGSRPPSRTAPPAASIAPTPTEADAEEADFEDELEHPDRRRTLREKALGLTSDSDSDSNSNPSQLGDPISLKAETSSSTIPTDDGEAGSGSESVGSPLRTRTPSLDPFGEKQKVEAEAAHMESQGRRKETLRGKAASELHGPDANPSMLGDPVSITAETSTRPRSAEEEDAGNSSRVKSKL